MAMTRRDATGSMFSPLAEALGRLFEESSRLIDEGSARSPTLDLLTVGQPLPVDIYETAEEYIIDVAAPGLPPQALSVQATEQEITLRGQWPRGARATQPGRYVRRERYEGDMERTLALPAPIDPDRIWSTYAYGLLTVHAPKIAQPQPASEETQAQTTQGADGLDRTAPIR
jgi:HSP20 family molecular chaperone IbpA